MAKRLLVFLLAICLVVGFLPAASATGVEVVPQFSDMPDNWSTAALNSAVKNGLLIGEDGKIMPENPLTRAQMATIIVRAFGATQESDISSYTDVKSSNWFAGSMAKANKMGVMEGYGGKMNPNSNITREQAFAVLARALNLAPASKSNIVFEDSDNISQWAKGEVYALANAGYIQGSNGKLHPKSNIKRNEFAQVMHNIFKQYISQKGEYTEVAEGNIMVNVSGVTLKGLTVKGDLIIGDGVGDGNVILEDVNITGRLVIRGGGQNSIIIRGSSSVSNIIVTRVDGIVRVKVEGDSNIEFVYVNDGSDDIIIEGSVGNVEILANNITVTATKANITSANISGSNSILLVDSASKVENVKVSASNTEIKVEGNVANITTSAPNTSVTGKGSVGKIEVQQGADGTKIETPNTEITVSDGVADVTAGGGTEIEGGSTATNNNTGTGLVVPSTGGGGGGGGSSTVAITAIDITGDTMVGKTLTAAPTPMGSTGNYQWQVSDNGTDGWTNISGATSSTYVVAPEYAFDYIRVEITGTGSYTGTQTSNATAQIQESTDASLASVLGQTDESPAGNGETPSTPISWEINVANEVETLGIADIQVAIGATAGMYSDASFSANGIASISLASGGSTVAYIKVTAQDTSARYYAVTINRAAPTVTGIAVDIPPTKVVYKEGEALALTGLVVTLTKSDATTEDIVFANFGPKGITTVKADGATLNTTDTHVIITHTESGQEITQAITVNPIIYYTVTFNNNGGDTSADPETISVEEETSLDALPAPPTKAGHAFLGWATADDATTANFDDTNIVSANINVYAVWSEITLKEDLAQDYYSPGDAIAFTIKGLPANTLVDISMPIFTGGTPPWASAQEVLDNMTGEPQEHIWTDTTNAQGELQVSGTVQAGLPYGQVHVTIPSHLDYGINIENTIPLMKAGEHVYVGFREIASVEALNDIEVDYGTEFAHIGLPAEVEVTLDDASTKNLAVNWDGGTPVYNGNTSATYVFTGTLTLTPGVANTVSHTATVNVIVAANKAALLSAISDANTNKATADVSVDGSNVLTTDKWVTAEVMTAYETAIGTAQGVYNDNNATQAVVDQAVSDLAIATTAFNDAKADGTLKEVPAVKTAVTATPVNAGQTLANSTLDGAFKDPNTDDDVAGSLTWNDDGTVVNETGSFDWTFTPTNTTDYATVTGSVEVVAIVDKDVLEAAISAANTNKATVAVSVDGSNVLTTDKWVTAEVMTAYETAIGTAQGIFADDSATQAVVDQAVSDLATATTAFNDTKAAGTLKAVPAVKTAVTATAVNAGQTLASSNLDGAFKDPNTDDDVLGSLAWDNEETVVNETGSFNWTFTPTNTADYATVTGSVEVVAIVDKSALEAAITAAENNRDLVFVSEDGAEVLTTEEWVTAAVMAVYEGAIGTAQDIFADDSETQAVVDQAVSDLATATTAFNDAKAAGFLITAPEGELLDAKAGTNFIGVLYKKIDGNIYYNQHDVAGNWLTEALMGAGSEGSLAIDSADGIHVAYTTSDGKIGYRMYDGVAWEPVELIASLNGGQCKKPHIAIDQGNNPHITYTDTMGDTAGTQMHDDIMYANNSYDKGGDISEGSFNVMLLHSGWYNSSYKQGNYFEKGSFIAIDSSQNGYILTQRRTYDHSSGVWRTLSVTIYGSNTRNLVNSSSGTAADRYDIYDFRVINNSLYALYRNETQIQVSEASINEDGEVGVPVNRVVFTASAAFSIDVFNNNIVIGSKDGSNLRVHYNDEATTYNDITVAGNAVSIVNLGGTFYAFYSDGADDNIIKRVEIEAPKEITDVAAIGDITVDYGTEFASIGLPAEVEVTLDDASTQSLAITWDGGTPVYSGSTAGTYVFEGTITLVSGIANTAGHTATVNVIVSPQTTFAITVAEVSGGSADVTTDPADQADVGDTVTVNIANIEAGKQFASIQVNGGAVATTQVTEGQEYTFVMPANPVEVEVTVAQMHTLSLSGPKTTSDPAAGLVADGTSVAITVSPETGQEVNTFTVGGVNKKADLLAEPANQYTFTLTEDTTVSTTIKLAQVQKPEWDGYAITWLDVDDALEYAVLVYKNGDDLSGYPEGTGVQTYDLTNTINIFGTGSYTATIRANANTDNGYWHGETSLPSDALVIDSGDDMSDFTVSLSVEGDKESSQEFNLDIKNAKQVLGQTLNHGSINVTVTSDLDGEVYNQSRGFTDGAITVPITLASAGEHTLTVSIARVTESKTLAVNVIGPSASIAIFGPVNADATEISAGLQFENTEGDNVYLVLENQTTSEELYASMQAVSGYDPLILVVDPAELNAGDTLIATVYEGGAEGNTKTNELASQTIVVADNIQVQALDKGYYGAGETMTFIITGLKAEASVSISMPINTGSGGHPWASDEEVIDGMVLNNGARTWTGTTDAQGELEVSGQVQSGLPWGHVHVTISEYGIFIDNAIGLKGPSDADVMIGGAALDSYNADYDLAASENDVTIGVTLNNATLSKIEDDLSVLAEGAEGDYTFNSSTGDLVILGSYLESKLTSPDNTVELILTFNEDQGTQHKLKIIITAIGDDIK